MDSSSSDNDENIPTELVKKAESAMENSLPEKSKKLYCKAYDELRNWMHEKGTTSFSETVLLAFFSDLSEKMAPATLWSKYSMLKSTLYSKKDISLKNYTKLITFLKRKNKGYEPKKAKAFTAEDVHKFLMNAPDEKYLAVKVAMILGVTGACRREELHDLTINHIQDDGTHLMVTVPHTKTGITRKFAVNEPFKEIVLKYLKLRPTVMSIQNLFLKYINGKCYRQVIGINKIGSMPQVIAEFLDLKEPKLYTGHSFRRTSATILADAGTSMTSLKRHGGWRFTQVAEGYIQESVKNKRKVCETITQSVNVNEESCDSSASNIIKKIKIDSNVGNSTGDASTSSNTLSGASIKVQLDNCSIQ